MADVGNDPVALVTWQLLEVFLQASPESHQVSAIKAIGLDPEAHLWCLVISSGQYEIQWADFLEHAIKQSAQVKINVW